MREKASGTDAQPGSERRRSGGLGVAHQRAKEAEIPKGNPLPSPGFVDTGTLLAEE